MREAFKRSYLLMLCGLAAGIVNGLLGAGSGVIVIFGMGAALGGRLADPRDLYANATAVILAISLFSAISYFVSGSLPAADLGRYLIPGVVGGLIGAVLLDRMSPRLIRRIFAIVVIFSGFMMIVR